MAMKQGSRSGFTLVELAIVLVIIGLIVGGVLVGQDLIKAATIRATVTDIEKYNAAATTFRGKYGGIPGDLLFSKAAQFGLATSFARSGASPGYGDGNGLIESCSVGGYALGCETAIFWMDLGQTGLLAFNSKFDITGGFEATASNATLAAGILPKTKLRDATLVTVFPNNGRNWYGLGALKTVNAGGQVQAQAGLTPREARGIDEKLDDGLPLNGTITAIVTLLNTPDAASATGPCIITGNTYIADTDAHLNAIGCALSIRTSF